MDEILDTKPTLKHIQVKTLDSMVFLKRGDRFEARPLPIEAQFSPVLAICVADFDADGNQDLFLADVATGLTSLARGGNAEVA